ncbi:MAG: FAD-linked oxidase [Chloroflexota bacterium]|nr:MAG: FAD-linked oxidase [Chloroflexota bacterium]
MTTPLNRLKQYKSWGRYPTVEHKAIHQIHWRSDLPDVNQFEETVLPYGYGRSYGDSCLNEGGILLDTSYMQQFMVFDAEQGLVRCEAGVSLEQVLEVIVPCGWFLPVTPGTKFVSIGGAIANDVHGKNHHRAGTFGCHVTQFELVRSDGTYICSPTENAELFRATIGGLGLTGIITWAEFKLKRIPSPLIDQEKIRFANLDEFFAISAEMDQRFEYLMSWSDCLSGGDSMGRGIFMAGNFYDPPLGAEPSTKKLKPFVPFDLPSIALNTLSVKAFNAVLYRVPLGKRVRSIVHYEPFYYPLDAINNWYRLYGKRGFLQYQLVVPFEGDNEPIREVYRRIAQSGEGSFLVVLKAFGDIVSPGMMSFPMPGVTLALDFAFNGEKTLKLLDELDMIVREAKGRVYPAKDARMSPENFRAYYPQWEEFAHYIDPKFSSSFWRRVTASANGQ